MKALAGATLVLLSAVAFAQEITIEEVRVESVFVSPLELPLSRTVDRLIEQLRLNDEHARALELRAANQSGLTTVLDLTRFSPVPLLADPRIDTFLQENYIRADLNSREKNPLFGSK